MMGILLSKAPLGDFIVVGASQSACTQTEVESRTPHLSEPVGPGLQAACCCPEYCSQLCGGISACKQKRYSENMPHKRKTAHLYSAVAVNGLGRTAGCAWCGVRTCGDLGLSCAPL